MEKHIIIGPKEDFEKRIKEVKDCKEAGWELYDQHWVPKEGHIFYFRKKGK